MANPELIDGFDKNDTNTAPVPDFLKNDGYADGQTVEAYEHNEMFKQLFAAANKNKNDGVWDWEDPTAPDATVEYNEGSMTRHLGDVYISLVDLNIETPTDDGINWFAIGSINEAYILEKIKLWQFQKATITPDADSDYTLTASENLFGRLILVDGSWLSGHNIIVDNTERSFLVDNSAGTYTATVKTSAGTGIAVLAGAKVWLLCDGTNVINSGLAPLASPTFTGTPTAPTPTAGDNTTKVATTAFVNTALGSALTDSGHSFTTNGYQKLSNGLIIQWGDSGIVASVTFPIAFPTACKNIQIAFKNEGTGTTFVSGYLSADSITASGFTYGYTTASISRFWFAIGY
ncbi:MAG: hypothetical protein PHW89_08080 [Sulfurimonas denitrificans]|nr:hypothetical protein [Sulfurimonas denitrificans]